MKCPENKNRRIVAISGFHANLSKLLLKSESMRWGSIQVQLYKRTSTGFKPASLTCKPSVPPLYTNCLNEKWENKEEKTGAL